MLLLLAFVHLLCRTGTAVPVPQTLGPRIAADSCDNINNCRKLFDIIWGCLATVFACTWVSVHPNVPPPDQSALGILWQRLKMMLVTIVAPEIIVGFAARQFFAARNLSDEYGFSRTHGFFFCMGGFVSSTGHPIVTKKQLDARPLGREFLVAIQHVNVEDIMDRSKGDALSKFVALVQGLWFTTQCLARVHQHLTLTELEVATLAFALVNIFIWLLWWEKPLDVQRQIVVGPPKKEAETMSPLRVGRFDGVAVTLFGVEESHHYDPLSSTSISAFWSLPVEPGRFGFIGPLGIEAMVGSMFGAIHCIAWNLDFGTLAEMRIWRSGSLLVTAIPPVIFVGVVFFRVVDQHYVRGIARIITTFLIIFSFPIYVLARFLLVILPLIGLRFLPPGTLVDVNWSLYIPHL